MANRTVGSSEAAARGRHGRSALVACAVLVAAATGACGPRFSSVRATAAVGAKLGDYVHALDNAPRYCGAFSKATGAPSPECDKLVGDVKRWRDSTVVLVGYSAALDELAGDHKLDVKDDVAAAIAMAGARLQVDALGRDQASGIAEVASALVSLFAGEYRNQTLGDVIGRTQPYVMHVVERTRDVLRLQQDTLGRLRDAILRGYDTLPPGAGRLGLYGFQIWVEDERWALLEYQKRLDAFAVAHTALARNVDKLDNVDFYKEVVKGIEAAVAGVKQAASTPSTPSTTEAKDKPAAAGEGEAP